VLSLKVLNILPKNKLWWVY